MIPYISYGHLVKVNSCMVLLSFFHLLIVPIQVSDICLMVANVEQWRQNQNSSPLQTACINVECSGPEKPLEISIQCVRSQCVVCVYLAV